MKRIHKNLSRREALAIIGIDLLMAKKLAIAAQWQDNVMLIAKMNWFAEYLRKRAKYLARIFDLERSLS